MKVEVGGTNQQEGLCPIRTYLPSSWIQLLDWSYYSNLTSQGFLLLICKIHQVVNIDWGPLRGGRDTTEPRGTGRSGDGVGETGRTCGATSCRAHCLASPGFIICEL